jgi:hypothetical protein
MNLEKWCEKKSLFVATQYKVSRNKGGIARKFIG